MTDLSNPRLSIRFQREFRNVPDFPNPTGLIPASTLGYVVAAVSELMRSTWDYATTNIRDERFNTVRKLEAQQIFQRREVELVIVDTRAGSLEIILDWLAPILASGVIQPTVAGMLPNALWDLTKYSFWSIHHLITRRSDNQYQTGEDGEVDPLTNRILPEILEIARNGYREHENDTIKTSFYYRDPDGREINFNIDRYTQGTLLETNLVETKIVTRLAGTIEGLNWRKRNITVRWEVFPDEEMVCDVDGMDLDELNRFMPHNIKQVPQRLGFDVELAWRRGVANVFPPDAIRIIGIMPADELLRPNSYRANGLSRPSIMEFRENLTNDEMKFLKWFTWADTNWDNPNIHGVVGYLTRNDDILGHSISRKEILEIIQSLVRYGIILKARAFTKRGVDSQVLRLNRNHPMVMHYGFR
ncbi:MAG: hypothetical protein KDE56_00585 [Anaerolineales bacterium]|nr:hypothetical protein [Anaerolineales bacterium]